MVGHGLILQRIGQLFSFGNICDLGRVIAAAQHYNYRRTLLYIIHTPARAEMFTHFNNYAITYRFDVAQIAQLSFSQ